MPETVVLPRMVEISPSRALISALESVTLSVMLTFFSMDSSP